ncbi:Fungal specific transcription factor domain-containing protein 24 [Elsinoe fawcettii]|nr:Fungal specific transcription factor domain-containing protein 24 [Elsinoe fawcettii]
MKLLQSSTVLNIASRPIWFSWDETKQREPKTSQAKVSRGLANDDADDNPAGYYHTLLQSTGRTKLFQALSTDTSRQLWQKYLSNVHPLTKIFLDWDKAPLMERAATDPDSLFPGQRAFVAAAHFIATLSLSEDDAPLILDRQQSSKGEILLDLQLSVESALMDAKYASTGELQVLQALVMYILAMRNRARPAECFSLMGIAVRIAQRLGIHRDGGELGLPPCKAEERRRTWWQMQYMEIMISQLLGCISVTLYCNWDAKIPANLDDHEIRPEMKDLPPDRQGLTSMSYVLWGYEVPHLQRQHFNPTHGAIWGSSSRLPSEKKQMMMDGLRKHFAERYVQYCELVNPLHVQIQIGLNSALLALQRAILQPTVGVSRLSEMPSTDREELLKVCVKAMDYFLLTRTNTTLAGFQWLNECWFQWTAFVYILVETERRATTSEAATLWTLIEQICLSHPKILTHTARPDISAIGRLILCAWQKRSDYLDGEQRQETKPSCVSIFEQAYATSTNSAEVDGHDLDLLPDTAFDFDLIDWSSWDAGNFWPEQLEDFQ